MSPQRSGTIPRPRKTRKGQINKLIDDLVHPCFKHHPALILADGLLHALVEKDPEMSFRNFVKYNAPKLLRHLAGKQK